METSMDHGRMKTKLGLMLQPRKGPIAKPVEISWGAPNYQTDLSRKWAEVHHVVGTCGGDIDA